MVTKIDILAPPRSRYQALHYMTEQLAKSLTKAGIKSRIFDSKFASDPKRFLALILNEKPDCTLSFNGLLPDQNGSFLCDYLQIPHVAYLVDSPQHFFPLIRSPLTLLACIDQFNEQFFQMFGNVHSFFLPHGADADLTADVSAKRQFDIVMLASFMDPEAIFADWQKKYSPPLVKALLDAAKMTLASPLLTFIEAFSESVKEPVQKNEVDPKTLNYVELFTTLEDYIRGIDRVETLQALRGRKVHLFGEGGWKEFAERADLDLVVHEAVSMNDAIQVMKESKIVLNCTPQIKRGGHERYFTSYLAGALPVTCAYPYLHKEFAEGAFYSPAGWTKLPAVLDRYLKDEKERARLVQIGAEKVLAKHTWDHRVKSLLEILPPSSQKPKNKIAVTTLLKFGVRGLVTALLQSDLSLFFFALTSGSTANLSCVFPGIFLFLRVLSLTENNR